VKQSPLYRLALFLLIVEIVRQLAEMIYDVSCNVSIFFLISHQRFNLKPVIPEKSLQELGKNNFDSFTPYAMVFNFR
jgi:hypothetical protein